MAYNFVSASSQYLTASAPATAAPMTIACLTNTTSQNILVSICNTTALNLFWTRFNGADLLTAGVVLPGPIIYESTRGTYTNGNWASAAGLFTSSTSRTAYLNGTAGTANTDSGTPSSVDTLGINARWNVSWGSFSSQNCAEVAVWNTNLTAAEITSLSKGFSPRRIRPQSLVWYSPLIRNLQDLRGGVSITNNNTATVAVHPRVY